MTEIRFTKHALERALEMGVEGEELRDCLLKPEEVFWTHKYQMHNYRRGRVTCGVDSSSGVLVVITVLWTTAHDWRADAARGGDLAASGREVRSGVEMAHLPTKAARA